MKTRLFLFALAVLLSAPGALSQAQARGEPGGERWIATSRTAQSITGDIRLSDSKLEMAGTVVPLRAAGTLPAWRTTDETIVTARLFEVTRPASLTLRNGNAFGCEAPVRWIVTYRSKDGRDLSMDTYTGRVKPRSRPSPTRPDRAAGLCATYLYTRPDNRR